MKRTPAKKRSEAERKRYFATMKRFCRIARLLPAVEDIDLDDEAAVSEAKLILLELDRTKAEMDEIQKRPP